MKRIQEKVKDIVEVRSYESIADFLLNPSQTLSKYHFTDMTSDLMAKWLDNITNIQFQNGTANALAGYRGVGKSHFLATLGAIVSQPELRSRITDSHVLTSAQRLKRRRHPVAYVKRGLKDTLLEEFKLAVAEAFEVDANILRDSVPEILHFAAKSAGDLPFVLLIDTALDRSSRVLRDDGMLLGEIAEVSKQLNIFVGVALDDDISGADGVNAAIARSYKIDYLDQEHLYRIVDTHVFPKQRQMTSVLNEIYQYFRSVLPSFRWSEQRFSALYPLHPVTLEITPFVRLYSPEFALLGFASETGKKIQGRPANSLIALDEVFDNVENTLRKVEDLKEAFATYDKLNSEVIGKIPIMQRLQAKLILKALFLLSLDGDGTTANEICAAMLIFDEVEPQKAVKTVEELIESFVSVLPFEIVKISEEGRETRYSFKVSVKENLQNALADAAKQVSPDVVTKIFRRIARDKFTDWTIAEEASENSSEWMDCQLIWRGGLRRGRVHWDLEGKNISSTLSPQSSEVVDWELFINRQDTSLETIADQNETPRVFWQPAELRKDEIDTIKRYIVLQTRTDMREEFGEQFRAASHTHNVAVEKIWNRVFLYDAKLVIDGFDYNFTEEARVATNLAEMLSSMLEPLFETRFPMHPYFAKTLGMTEVSTLVNDLFSGARQNLEEVQNLAETFALPLGLVALKGDTYILETEENLLNLPLANEVMAMVNQSGSSTVSLKNVYRQLKKTPNGLVREAQHLILTALVAQRQIEFVTTKGDRINRRSLDLKIIWHDIEGIAKPIGMSYSSERLTNWAKTLTGADNFTTIENPEDREAIKIAFQNWLDDWRSARVLDRFGELPDEILNTKIWRIATHAKKTFGSVAETVKSILDDAISIDEGLHRIADAFSDSETEFFQCTQNLVVMEDFISGADRREIIWAYLAVCEPTNDEAVEETRENLLEIIEESYENPSELKNREMDEVWDKFKRLFTDYFSYKHDSVMKSHDLLSKFDDIIRSDEWWEFENLSKISVFQQNYRKEANALVQRLKQLDCRYNVREMLKTHPFCACSFNLSQSDEWEKLPKKLWETLNQGRISFRKCLLMLRETILPLIDQLAVKNGSDAEFMAAVESLKNILSETRELKVISNNELMILQKIFSNLPTSPMLNLKLPPTGDFQSREDLRKKVNQWLDDLPDDPVLVKI
ncbi:MAG TPA: hypothetical protein PKY59_14625 [Pyrinomonadaceae bacterium]|nr:hypothetical protein [Pyrinomonadaceae bacterium]